MGANSSKSPPNGGLRVHRVYPNGPGDVAGIEPFFDFVLDADGYTYTDDSDETLNLFTKYVSDHENQQICLNVFNARKKSIREVFIVPQKWDGIGYLGLTLKFGLFNCLDEGAHIVHVYDKSPAQKAGLLPITDYLLGTNLQLFYDLDCVRIHVGNQIDKEVVLLVYNSVTETVRRAVIVPRENWGGKGTLGCDLAKGYIHRIPYVKSLFTYPAIDAYSTFDSTNNGEVVDTIDLSIGNVDNYYNNSVTTTMRQEHSQEQATPEPVAPTTSSSIELEVKLDGSNEPASDHESHEEDLRSPSHQYYQEDSDDYRRPQHDGTPPHELHDTDDAHPNPELDHNDLLKQLERTSIVSHNLDDPDAQRAEYEESSGLELNYEEKSDSYRPPSMLNLQSDFANPDSPLGHAPASESNHKDRDSFNGYDKDQMFQF